MSFTENMKILSEEGYSQEELGQYALQTYQELSGAGYTQHEIDKFFGHPEFDATSLNLHFENILRNGGRNEQGELKQVTDIWDAFKAGFGLSASGLLAYKPEAIVAPDAGMASRIASNLGSIAGDSPFYIGAYIANAGNPVTGTAAGLALSQGIAQIMMDKYEKGEVASFHDFWERASSAFLRTFKGYVTGAATGKAGQLIGGLPISSTAAKTLLIGGGEMATMVAVGSALDGHIPEPMDFVDAAVTLGFLRASAKVAGKLRQVYAKHLIHPKFVVADAAKDVTIKQDLASQHIVIPTVYEAAAMDAIIKARRPVPPEPIKTGEYVETPPPQATITELAKRMQYGVEQTSKTGAFYEPGQPPVARVTPPYEAKPAPKTPITELAGPEEADLIATKARLDQAREAETSVFEKSRAFRTAEEILQEQNRLRAAEDMILQEQHSALREKRYFPPVPRQTPEEMMVDKDGRSMTTGEWLSKELEKHGIIFGEKGEAKWEESIPPNDAQAAILSKISYDDPVAPKMSARAIYTAIFDNLNPILGDLKDIGKSNVPTAEHAYELERLTRGTYGRAQQWLHHGVVDFDTLQPVTRGYLEITKPVKKDLQGLTAYEVSKRVIEKESQGIQTGFDLATAKIVVREGKAKYEHIHQELIRWRDAMVDYMVKAQAVAERDANIFRRANRDYVPWHRLFEDEAPTTVSRGLKNPIKRMTGSEKNIHDPVVADIKNAFLFAGLAERNAARLEYVKYPELATKVRTGREPLSVDELKKVIEELGVTDDAAEAISILHPKAFRSAANELVVFEKGERTVYKVNPATAEAFADLDRVSTNFLTEMLLHTPANLLRAGVILTPEYISRNLIRDAVSVFVYTGSHPIRTIKGGVSIIRKDPTFQKWLAGGGANATMVAIDREYIQNHIMDLNQKTGMLRRAWNVARTPLDVLRAVSEFIENSTRLGSVHSEMKQAKDRAAILALSMISRESTVDFARHGKALQEFGKTTAFFNPFVQGNDRFFRALKHNPQATLARAFGSITLPALYLWWANKDDEEIKRLSQFERNTMLIARIPLPDGDSFLLRIPLAHEIGILFATLPIRLLEAYLEDHPDAMRDLDKTLMEAFTPSMVPTAVLPILQQYSNINILSGGPLIPARLEKVLPPYQHTPYTTELTKTIGGIMGSVPWIEEASLRDLPFISGAARAVSSPILIENYIRQMTGGMGVHLLRIADAALRSQGVIPDPVKPSATLAEMPVIGTLIAQYPSLSAQPIQNFYEDAERIKIIANTQKLLMATYDPRFADFAEKHRADMAKLEGFTQTLEIQNKLIRLLDQDQDATPEEKRQLIDTIYIRMIEIAEAGNLFIREMKKTVDALDRAHAMSFKDIPKNDSQSNPPSLSAPMRQQVPNQATPPSIGP